MVGVTVIKILSERLEILELLEAGNMGCPFNMEAGFRHCSGLFAV
jgi:hypothetical protein